MFVTFSCTMVLWLPFLPTVCFSFWILRADTVVENKLAFKLAKTTGHCTTVQGKVLTELHFLVTILYQHTGVQRNTELAATLIQKLGKLVFTVSSDNIDAAAAANDDDNNNNSNDII